MDADDLQPLRPDDPLARLTGQDLDSLSVAELETRIALLTREIDRCKAKIEHAVNHKAIADALFRKQ